MYNFYEGTPWQNTTNVLLHKNCRRSSVFEVFEVTPYDINVNENKKQTKKNKQTNKTKKILTFVLMYVKRFELASARKKRYKNCILYYIIKKRIGGLVDYSYLSTKFGVKLLGSIRENAFWTTANDEFSRHNSSADSQAKLKKGNVFLFNGRQRTTR